MSILIACELDDLATVKEMVMKDPSLVNKRSFFGWTPMYYASYDGQLAIVEFLVSRGAVVNDNDYWEDTPLHMVSMKGHLVVVKLLVSKGADVNWKGQNGWTPLYMASGHWDIAKYIKTQPVREVFLVICHSRCMPHDLVRSLFTYFL
jgi:ankyrin repeat protein